MSQEETTTAPEPVSTEALELEYALPPKQRFNPFRWARREPFGAFGLLLIIIVAVGSGAAPILNTVDPQAFATGAPLSGPCINCSNSDVNHRAYNENVNWREHRLFGVTSRGRDLWSRVLYGGRVSLKIGVVTVLIGTLAGTVLALVSTYAGGIVDFTVGRLADMIIAIPGILLALTLHTAIGEDLPDLPALSRQEFTITLAISAFFLPGTYRIMRGMVLELRESQYVEAAQVVGANAFRIMWRHISPNMFGLMIVITSISLPAAILTEASLSFLGIGVERGTPSWGADLSGDSRQFFQQGWWLAVFPGLALSMTVFGFNIFGDALRDTLDPRLRGRI
tara:strand:- start:11000 stop:12013 length:1014 start_codon:yes stop_codon:yes gene_type:complete